MKPANRRGVLVIAAEKVLKKGMHEKSGEFTGKSGGFTRSRKPVIHFAFSPVEGEWAESQ